MTMITLRNFIRNAIPIEIRALRWGDRDPLRRIMWKYFSSKRIVKALEEGVLYSRQNYPFEDIQRRSDALNPGILNAFDADSLSAETHEMVCVFNQPAFIEPQRGWIICNPFHLVDNCLRNSSEAPRPAIRNYVKTRLFQRSKVTTERAVISLRDIGEQNYYHALIDLIGGRLRLAEHCNLDPNMPLVVGKAVYQKSFFQDILRKSELRKRRLIIQGDDFILCEKVYFFETDRTNKKSLEYLVKLLNVPDSNQKSNRRVFLTRSPHAGRNIKNINVIEEVCRKFQFEIVDTSMMSLDGQIELFSGARYVIGIHGAGLTNIIFRKNGALTLLEIFPPVAYQTQGVGPPPHYFWMACALGFEYDAIFGQETSGNRTAPNYRNSFEVDANLLSSRIESMLN